MNMMAKSSVTGVGFNVWSPPRPPLMPMEKHTKYRTVSETYDYNDHYEIPLGATHVKVINNGEYYGSRTVIFEVGTEIPNPQYAKELARYNKQLAKYEKDLKKWEEKKKEWDVQQAEKELRMKKAQLKRLKKEIDTLLGVE